MGSAGAGLDLQPHQALAGEADHLAEQVRVELCPSNVRRYVTSFVIEVLSLEFSPFTSTPVRNHKSAPGWGARVREAGHPSLLHPYKRHGLEKRNNY